MMIINGSPIRYSTIKLLTFYSVLHFKVWAHERTRDPNCLSAVPTGKDEHNGWDVEEEGLARGGGVGARDGASEKCSLKKSFFSSFFK